MGFNDLIKDALAGDTDTIEENIDISRLDEAGIEPAVKTFMDLWSKRLGLSMRIVKAKQGQGGHGEFKYLWKDYNIGAYTKTNIFLGHTSISFATDEETQELYLRSVNGESSGLFMGAGWDENNIDRAKKDIEKTMNKLYPGPKGSSKDRGHELAKVIAKKRA